MKLALPLAALALALSATAAQAQDEAGEPASPLAQDTAWHNKQQLALASLKAADGWAPLEGNIRWRRVAGSGSGRRPKVTDTVTLHYAGTLTTGAEFDSSWTRGEPATFPLNQLVRGWQIAVPMAAVGDTIEIAIPSDYAYGPIGRGPIPPNATLFFKVQLISIDTPAG
ncbi:MAG: FKBP-type peptidyl-prolyl cis-trans isomerase [Sphingomonas sp.]